MYCLARQNGHFQSQIVVPQPPSLFSVQPNVPTMLCDRFMGTFKTIALLVLSPANTSEYKKSNVKDINIIKRKIKAMIVIAPSSLFCILTSNVLCIPWKQVIIWVLQQTDLQRKLFTFTPLLFTGNVSSISDAKGRTSVATSRNHFH